MREKIRKQVLSLLRKHDVVKAPIPVSKIAEKEGIEVRMAPAGREISGALIRSPKDVVIAINSSEPPTRQRFTIAHELGHFFMHKGANLYIDEQLSVNFRDKRVPEAKKEEEIEANFFAAELLMPTHMIQDDAMQMLHIGEAQIEQLARRYRVSEKAMAIRLATLGVIEPD